MVALLDLWLPILLSAVFVFLISSVIHMAIPIHKNDFEQLPNEESVLEALRQHGIRPGAYMFPRPQSMKEMGSPEMIARYERGPVGHLIVRPKGAPAMGAALIQWFLFCLLIGLFVAYVASLGLARGTAFTPVFQLTGAVALPGYALGSISESIWKGQSWIVAAKFFFDGLLYALATAVTFAWLWPGA